MTVTAEQAAAELARRNDAAALVTAILPFQGRIFASIDLHNKVAALGPRRQGKSRGILQRMIYRAKTIDDYRGAWIEDYPQTAWENIIPILEKLDEAHGLKYTTDAVHHTIKGQGWQIRCYGMRHEKFISQMRGKEFDDVVIDEMQRLYMCAVTYHINNDIQPTLDDRRGTLQLGGTAPHQQVGLWYAICRMAGIVEGDEPGRRKDDDPAEQDLAELFVDALVRAQPFENPHVADAQRAKLAEYRTKNPNIDQEPWVRREYFGECVVDARRLMVVLRPELNYLYEWEPDQHDEYHLGIDWGYAPDPSAYVLAVFNPYLHPYLIYLEAWERGQMRLRDHAEAIDKYLEKYPGLEVVSDHSKERTVELINEHNLPIKPAKKIDKEFHVDKLNSEASLGQIKVFNIHDPRHPETNAVAKQWNRLSWHTDPVSKLRVEGRPRHIHDAALYLRRQVNLDDYREPVEPVELTRMELARKEAKFHRSRAFWQ